MESSAAFETLLAPERPEAVAESELIARSAAITHSADTLPSTLCSRRILRFGGLAMDALTGATSWRGKMVALPVADRDLLCVFLRRAGQIISRQQLAATLGISAEALDHRVKTVREALANAGSTCLPYRVEGLGYVLWRG
jgi:DNA-binding response OmpR family regulator